jgi:hypothetical protein
MKCSARGELRKLAITIGVSKRTMHGKLTDAGRCPTRCAKKARLVECAWGGGHYRGNQATHAKPKGGAP